MNKDQVKGKVTDIAGKAQEKLGELTGSKEQQAKGFVKQVKGKVQEGVGDVKDAIHKADKEAERERDKPH
jgi:uncharacterized protein YjbJ (UPF0337 family)